MRYSMEKTDPGYEPYGALKASGKDVNVFLNDVKQTKCVTADDEAGIVVRYCEDQRGAAGARLLTETVAGVVRLEIFEPRGWE